MRRDPEWFGEREMELIQLSRKLKEALKVEAILTDAGIEYTLEVDSYKGTMFLVIPTERKGVFFYVPTEDAASVRDLLAGSGFQVMRVEE